MDNAASAPPGVPDDRGLPPEIPHPTSADPYGMFASLRELSSFLLVLAGATTGLVAATGMGVLLSRGRERPAETTAIVVGGVLLVLAGVLYWFAAFARRTERDKKRQELEGLIKLRIEKALPSVVALKRAEEFIGFLGSLTSRDLDSLERLTESEDVNWSEELAGLHRKAQDFIQSDGCSRLKITDSYWPLARKWGAGRLRLAK